VCGVALLVYALVGLAITIVLMYQQPPPAIEAEAEGRIHVCLAVVAVCAISGLLGITGLHGAAALVLRCVLLFAEESGIPLVFAVSALSYIAATRRGAGATAGEGLLNITYRRRVPQ
jgi:hypothetical protein